LFAVQLFERLQAPYVVKLSCVKSYIQ
jgi:hypothetical protein